MRTKIQHCRFARQVVKLVTCLAAFSFSQSSGFAQTVTGKVVSAKDQTPIAGVTVEVTGTSQGAVTANDGSFTVKAATGSTLRLSIVGYQPKAITVTNPNLGTIIMEEDVKALSSVVVVGYGTQKKVNLTGSVATMDMA